MKRALCLAALVIVPPACAADRESHVSAGATNPVLDASIDPDDVSDSYIPWDGSPEEPTPVDASDEIGGDSSIDSSKDAGEESAIEPFIPAELRVGLIHTGPSPQTTPATWNAHLPKIVGDGAFWYAVHTHYPPSVADRYAAIMRREAGSALHAWVEVARIAYPHQSPGIVMDISQRLHLIFDCMRPATQDVLCFPGGAGTTGRNSRFYHLIFSTRDGSGALRFDTYSNHDEWTAESNGYQGIATTTDGVTVWALADSAWGRVVQWWYSGAQYGTIGTLTAAPAYLLYPILTGHPSLGSSQLILYAGEFDPAGGNNASYLASTAYVGNTSSLSQLFRRAPAQPVPGIVSAYPSDLEHDAQGTLYAPSYLPKSEKQCTELLRFDSELAQPPTIVPVGCVSNYAKLKFASHGALYLLDAGPGATISLGVSMDRGDSWTWHSVPITGLPSNGDIRYVGYTPVKPYTSPLTYEPNRWVVFFSGLDESNGSVHSYVGEMDLAP